jgi:pimeloyl-ACP methyl ester carboxylesterase
MYLAEDVVGYVDTHYRTLPVPASRGIAGHSMGGFGAWHLALNHTELFGAVYMMSPGLFDPAGLAESQMFAAERTIEGMVSYRERVAGLSPSEVPAALRTAPDLFAVAYGVAFAPNPESPLLFDYPYTRSDGELVRDDAVWARWEAGFGNLEAEVAAGADNLSRLNGLVIDYGRRDEYAWIPKGCVYLDEVLTEVGIPHRVAVHDGTHNGSLGDRIREHMLPFFAETLGTG